MDSMTDTAPPVKAPRKARAKAPDTCSLTLHVRGVAYGVKPVAAEDTDVIRMFRLRKLEGDREVYHVAFMAAGYALCDCADAIYRERECKHCRSLRAVGLIGEPEPTESHPSQWGEWADERWGIAAGELD